MADTIEKMDQRYCSQTLTSGRSRFSCAGAGHVSADAPQGRILAFNQAQNTVIGIS